MHTKRDLTQGSIPRGLLGFALPLILGNLLQQLYNLADTWVVGQFIGEGALAAVGSSYTLMTFLTSILLRRTGSGPSGLPLPSPAAAKTAGAPSATVDPSPAGNNRTGAEPVLHGGSPLYPLHPIRQDRQPQPLRRQPADAGTAEPCALA